MKIRLGRKSILPLVRLVLLTFVVSSLVSCSNAQEPEVQGLSFVNLPPGFKIDYFATGISGARSLALGDSGTVFVGTRTGSTVRALVDVDGDHRVDSVYVVASGYSGPNGVAFRDGALYFAQVSKVWRIDSIESRLATPPDPVLVSDAFPTDAAHGWKFIKFGPDDKLYVPIGAPCNICDPSDERYASIMRMDPDGSNLQLFAEGIRNTVGFDWNPATDVLWFTDNGRDWLGDNQPPDELNRAPEPGMHFGYPYCQGGDISDPDFGHLAPCDSFVPPAQKLGPHVASLGMRFYDGDMFPAEYRDKVFIAEHGSWNRSTPIGYRVTMVTVEGDSATSYDVFADGWLAGDNKRGRPVDVEVMPDGSLLVSDDYAGAVYRISYE